MFNIFSIIPLLFFIITSYFFNYKKLNETKMHIILISFIEAIVSFLIVFIFFLHGFIPTYTHILVLFFLSIFIALALLYIEKDLDNEWDLQIETIKNNLVLFMITLLPLYVFLTIFRYMNGFIQVILSILFTTMIFYLAVYFRRIFNMIYPKIKVQVSESGPSKYVLLFLSFGIMILLIIMFDLPTNKVSKPLNLSNNIAYLNFDGFPKILNNHYHENKIFEVELDSIDSKVTDYYCSETHVYVYTSKGALIIFDISTKEVVSNNYLSNNPTSITPTNTEIYNKFTFFNGHLILLGHNGTYLVNSTNTTTKISDLNYHNTSKFYHNQELYYVKKRSPYEIYQFTDGQLTLHDTIDLNTSSYEGLKVLSDHLFYIKEQQYIPYDNQSIAYTIQEGLPIYDKNRQIMYFTYADEELQEYTKYRKVDSNGKVTLMTLSKVHNHRGIIVDDMIYFTEDIDEEMDRIEIMNSEFTFDSIYNHLTPQPFWFDNQILSKSYVANYQEKNHTLEYLQVDQKTNQIVLTIKQLEDREVDLKLPFYSHYGLGVFIPIFIALFIPLTNYRSTITTLDFKYAIKSKK